MAGKTRQNPVRSILFDMDNTLFDLVGAQMEACRQVADRFGNGDGDELFDLFLSAGHGFESHENIRQYLRERDIPENGEFEEACIIYDTVKLRQITPYPGVTDTIHSVRSMGYPLGIVTDAEKKDALLRLDKCGLTTLFDCLVTFDQVQKKKPAHEPFLVALRSIGAAPRETLFVGDSPRRDIEPCHCLGMMTVYARYGDRFSDDRSHVRADYIIDRMDELPGILARIGQDS